MILSFQMYQEHLRRSGQMPGPRHAGINPLDPYDHLVRTPSNMPRPPPTTTNNQHVCYHALTNIFLFLHTNQILLFRKKF